MSHQHTLDLLKSYQAATSSENSSKQRILKFVTGNSRCFEACHPPVQGEESGNEVGHVTGSAWVLSPDHSSVLLTHHKKLNKWLQLGGHSDGEANVILTSLREAEEESGIKNIQAFSDQIFDVDVHTFPAKKGVTEHLHYDIRFALVAPTKEFKLSDESNELRWFSFQEILEGDFQESLKRMARKSIAL